MGTKSDNGQQSAPAVFLEQPPDWYANLLPFPKEWAWTLNERLLPQGSVGVFQPVRHDNHFQKFGYDSMHTTHSRWFFERGVYAVVQPRTIQIGFERTVYGLAFYHLKQVDVEPELVFHVTPRERVAKIRDEGILTGRRAGECTSTWKEAIDFVHVWETCEQALAWPENKKLKAVFSGPWSVVKLAPRSPLYEDPKSEPGGWVFGCDVCVPASCIGEVTDI